MQFIVNSSYLLKQLTHLYGVIASNPVLPILGNFLLEVKENNLTVTTSDLQTSMTGKIKVESKQSGSIAVPARILLETLRNLPNQPITFSVKESTYSLDISSEKGKYKLSGENAMDFPKTPSISNDFAIKMPAETLLKAINSTVFATSNDELRPEMGGVYIDFTDQGVIFVATDGHRLVRYSRTDIASNKGNSIIIPRKALQLLKTMLTTQNGDIEIEYNVSNAFFKYGDTSMICRLIDERFPDYKNAIPLENPIKIVLDRTELLGLFKRISIYANQTTHQIKLKITGSELQASAEDLDFSNEAVERLSCEHDGEDLEIGFNAKLFIDVLSNLDTDQVQINMSSPNKASIIAPLDQEENEDILMLVVPIMLNYDT